MQQEHKKSKSVSEKNVSVKWGGGLSDNNRQIPLKILKIDCRRPLIISGLNFVFAKQTKIDLESFALVE